VCRAAAQLLLPAGRRTPLRVCCLRDRGQQILIDCCTAGSRRSAAAAPQPGTQSGTTRASDLGCESAENWLLPSTPIIAIVVIIRVYSILFFSCFLSSIIYFYCFCSVR